MAKKMKNNVTYREYAVSDTKTASDAELRYAMRSGSQDAAAELMGRKMNHTTDLDKIEQSEREKKEADYFEQKNRELGIF